MRFEARNLQPFSSPVTKDELQVCNIYFMVSFLDDRMLCPELVPVVYIGADLEPEELGKVYFQDLDSHKIGVRFNDGTRDSTATFYSGSSDEMGHVFTFENALEVLLACSLRRRATNL
jgi:hypothetical protein